MDASFATPRSNERRCAAHARETLLDEVSHYDDELLAQHSTESIDLPGAMKPFLEEGKIRFVGLSEVSPAERVLRSENSV